MVLGFVWSQLDQLRLGNAAAARPQPNDDVRGKTVRAEFGGGRFDEIGLHCGFDPSFTGQVWANRAGLQRVMLKTLDKWIAAMATGSRIH